MFNNLKGKSISFEGGEGSGKSTIIKNIIAYLNERSNIDCVATREPGGVRISEQIREVIVSKDNREICAETEALLFAAARAQFMTQVIRPSIEEEKTIFIDRFVDSSLVYQGIARGLGVDRVWEINKMATNGWVPDLTIILDLDPEVGLKRISDNNRETNRLDEEDLSFHYAIREGYHSLVEMYPERNIVIIDANRPVEDIVGDIIEVLVNL